MTLPSSFFPEMKYNPGRKELTSIFRTFALMTTVIIICPWVFVTLIVFPIHRAS